MRMTGALEQFINNVQTMSAAGNHAQLAELARLAMKDTLVKHQQHLDSAIQTLDLAQHTIGILAIMNVRATNVFLANNLNESEGLFAQIQEVATGCDQQQARFVIDIYVDLFRRLSDWLLLKKQQPSRGICVLASAIRRIQTEPTQLTSLHANLCCLCLKAKVIQPAFEFLDADITDIAKENTHGQYMDSKHFLSYFYYGGIIYSVNKQYERAMYFFEVALTTPAVAVSQIVIEAFKKYTLVSLIFHGKLKPLPSYKPPVLNRTVKPQCQDAYLDLVGVYEQNESRPDKVADVVDKHRSIYQQDKNYGLVNLVLKSMYKRNILRLTKTFLTLSLSDVANRCQLQSPSEAESYILKMIEDGEIMAKIDLKNGMVNFLDSPDTFSDTGVEEMIDSSIGKATAMSRQLTKLDTDILLNPQYVSKILKSGGPGSSAPTFPGLALDDEGIGTPDFYAS